MSPAKKLRRYSMSRPDFVTAANRLTALLWNWLARGNAHALVSFNGQYQWVFSKTDLTTLALQAGFTAAAVNGAIGHFKHDSTIRVLIAARHNRGYLALVQDSQASKINQLAALAKDPGIKSSQGCLRLPRKAVEDLNSVRTGESYDDAASLLQKFEVIRQTMPDGPDKPGVWEFCPPPKLTPELRDTFNAQFRTRQKKTRRHRRERVLPSRPQSQPAPTPAEPATAAFATVEQFRDQLTGDRARLVDQRAVLNSQITELDALIAAMDRYFQKK